MIYIFIICYYHNIQFKINFKCLYILANCVVVNVLQLTGTKSDDNEFTWDERPEWDKSKPHCNVPSCVGLGFINFKSYQNHWKDFHVQFFNISCCLRCPFTSRLPSKLRGHQKLKGHNGVETRRTLNSKYIPNLGNMPYRPSLRPMNDLPNNSMEFVEQENLRNQGTVARDELIRIDYHHPDRPVLVRRNPGWFPVKIDSPWNPLTPNSEDQDFV